MVSLKVDADARARVAGDESLERYPIVAKVKGTGKEGALGVQVQVSGEGSPVAARVSLDGPVEIKIPELQGFADALASIASGIKVELAARPVTITLAKIPVDITVSVYSPAQEQAFKVEIKGSIGEGAGPSI